ncbi:hypothetical protein O3W44_18800 [Pantoea sp. LMR881]|uniref:hypothetical protein n=1 Tax=Pantoea sp. LMR881 TaxID=3014336 RepID=UPI0022B038E0|nr:hypothetical protein [Pantoea sp. LMR881]MCZ4060708.1 hypothetical protein [Pantoea sp. LMR881]
MHHDINNANILYDDANGFNLIDFDDATILPKGKKLDALQTEEIRKKVNSAIEKFIKYINGELTLRDVL